MLFHKLIGSRIQTTSGGDPNFANVSLLLHAEGSNGSTVITDSSSFMNTVSVIGNAAISTAQRKFGSASIFFDGAGDRLSIAASSNFDFGTGDFTIETWVYQSGGVSGFPSLITRQQNIGAEGLYQLRLASGVPEFVYCAKSSSSIVVLAGTAAIALNTWVHLAFSRSGSTGRLFVDGNLVDTKTTSGTLDVLGRPLTIGALNETSGTYLSQYFTGYLDEVRITKGVARYTANFTPPTVAFPDN